MTVSGAAPDPDLVAAEKSFKESRYQEVLPHLRHALDRDLAPPERRRAFELQAMTHAAFDDGPAAVESFRHVLGIDPDYDPGPVSPKVRAWFEEARRRGAIGGPKIEPVPVSPRPESPSIEAAAVAPPPATPAAEKPAPVFAKAWFWVLVAGVVVAGAGGTTAFALTRPGMPSGNLGTGALR